MFQPGMGVEPASVPGRPDQQLHLEASAGEKGVENQGLLEARRVERVKARSQLHTIGSALGTAGRDDGWLAMAVAGQNAFPRAEWRAQS